MAIKFKVGELMAKKASSRGQRVITLAYMERELIEMFGNGQGISRNTLAKLADGKAVKGISWDVLEKLCLYFECQPGDLISLENSNHG